MDLGLRPLDASSAPDFESVMCRVGGEAQRCLCTAVYVPYWKDASLARPCRARIFAEGRSDGFVLVRDGEAVGWCQAAPRDEMPYFVERSRAADPGDGVVAVTCLLVVPEARGGGLAHAFLRLVLDELRRRGARRVQAFACRYAKDEDTSAGVEFPESLCVRAGMTLVEDHAMRPMYRMD